ncbi:MAG: peptidoglycan DD-metalloendopeptidase family protein [Deltaproteobacteria bacterium]|nr:peptidoglycan DD-metalloendopeptidase family protein [Deltaproteobacteria bacterium]
MVSKKTTILFIPRGLHKVRKISFSRGALFSLLFFIFITVLSVIWFATDYIKIKTKMPELQYLKKENKFQKTHIIALSKKINQINQAMAKLQKFEHKLRVMTNLEPSKQHEELLAVGGSNESTLASAYQLEEVHKGLIKQMHKSLEDLERKTAIASISQSQLNDFLKEQKSILACTPSIRPTDGWLSSGFGYRISPFTNRREFHKGIDIATSIGTPVIAPADGLVADAYNNGNFGKMIVINHGYNLKTRYGHLGKFRVKKGQHVKRGQIIGEVGNTGRCTGPHLHYEVLLDGVPVNPLRFIQN